MFKNPWPLDSFTLFWSMRNLSIFPLIRSTSWFCLLEANVKKKKKYCGCWKKKNNNTCFLNRSYKNWTVQIVNTLSLCLLTTLGGWILALRLWTRENEESPLFDPCRQPAYLETLTWSLTLISKEKLLMATSYFTLFHVHAERVTLPFPSRWQIIQSNPVLSLVIQRWLEYKIITGRIF